MPEVIYRIKPSRYTILRNILFWILTVGTMAIVGFLLYKELSTPLTQPIPTGISPTVPPQTGPPTAEAKAQHSVPANYPKYLLVPKLRINTNVYALGTTKDGAIDAPQTAWGVGWYRDGHLPGSGSGAALIDGHVNDAFNTPGVFYELSKLVPNDDVTVVRGDDSQLHYRVMKVSEEPLKSLDMNKVLSSIESGKEGLNLITCGGKYDKATNTYTDRTVVYTVRVS